MEKIPRCPVEKEFDRKSAQEIMQSMDASSHNLSICCWGMRAFASIAGSALMAQDTHSLAEFLDDGGCECVVNVMNKYCDCSDVVATYGLLTISILAWCMSELKEFLGELGACEVVVYAISMHIGHPDISEYGSRAIYALARQNITNSYKLSSAGACDVLVQVGNFGFNIRDERCKIVALNTCLATTYLCEALNAQALHDYGASALITELVRLHHSDEEFAVAGVKSLCALGSLSAHIREDLGLAGACKLLVDILRKHDNTQIQLDACEAIMHISLNPNNADRLSSAGACDAVVAAGGKLMNIALGPEICTGAMLHLATYGSSAKDNRECFIRAGARELLKEAQFNVKASYRARENIQQLFELIGNDDLFGGISRTRENPSVVNLVSVIHGSEMTGRTLPLQVEVREVIEGEGSEYAPSPNSTSSLPGAELLHPSDAAPVLVSREAHRSGSGTTISSTSGFVREEGYSAESEAQSASSYQLGEPEGRGSRSNSRVLPEKLRSGSTSAGSQSVQQQPSKRINNGKQRVSIFDAAERMGAGFTDDSISTPTFGSIVHEL